jgi:hypothetical protein
MELGWSKQAFRGNKTIANRLHPYTLKVFRKQRVPIHLKCFVSRELKAAATAHESKHCQEVLSQNLSGANGAVISIYNKSTSVWKRQPSDGIDRNRRLKS